MLWWVFHLFCRVMAADVLQRFHPDIAKFVKALLDNGGFGVCGELPKVSDPKTRYGIGESLHTWLSLLMNRNESEDRCRRQLLPSTTISLINNSKYFCFEIPFPFLRNCCRNILLGRGCNFNPCIMTLVNFLLFFTACHIHATPSDLATGSKYWFHMLVEH